MAGRFSQSLRALLAAHDPSEPTEVGYIDRFLGLLQLPGDVFDADHFIPGHVTVSAFVASTDSQAALLIHHAQLERWLQPGGHVESEDATLEAGARRELAEEVGLSDLIGLGLLDIDIHTFPERQLKPRHLHFDVRFGFHSRSDSIAALDGVLDVRWVRFGEIPLLTAELSVLRPVDKLRQLLR